MNMKETTVRKNYVFKGKIINVRCDDAALPDGKPCTREFVEHGGGAAVLYVRGGEVLLVKQFRYAYGEELYEIPAGKLEKGEDPALTAARELEEEAGFVPEKVTLLYERYPSPGYTNEKIYIYSSFGTYFRIYRRLIIARIMICNNITRATRQIRVNVSNDKSAETLITVTVLVETFSSGVFGKTAPNKILKKMI